MTVNNKDTDAIIDTGSNYSIIDKSLLPKNIEIEKISINLTGPTNEDVDILGETELEIYINDKRFMLKTLVGKNITSGTILGMNFLVKNNAIINFETNYFQLGSKKKRNLFRKKLDENWILSLRDIQMEKGKNTPVNTTRDIKINPQGKTKIEIRIPEEYKKLEKKFVTWETTKDFEKYAEILPHLNFDIKRNKTYVDLYNYSNKIKTIQKGTCVGHIKFQDKTGRTQNEKIEKIHNVQKQTEYKKTDKGELCDAEGTPFQISDTLTKEQKTKVEKLLETYYEVFTTDPLNVDKANIEPFEIRMLDEKPLALRGYKLTLSERREMRKILDKMMKAGIIRRSSSPYSSPAFLKQKADGNYRFLCNFAQLNSKIERDQNSVPRVDNIFLAMEGAKFYTRLDANQGFFQIPLAESSKKYTAIIVDNEIYEFERLPQGLSISPSLFSRVMAQHFSENLYKDVVVYMDDICAYGDTFEKALSSLKKTLEILRKMNLKLKTEKCVFFEEEIQLLGHKISEKGISTLDKNVKTIKDFKKPKTKKEVRRFLGACSYYRKFIKNFSKLAVNLTDLTKGDPHDKTPIKWTPTHEKEFNNLKELLASPPILAIYKEGRETKIELDGSARAIGGVLSQKNEITGKWHPIAYYSEKMPEKYTNAIAYDIELTALVSTLQHFREYLYGAPKFTVYTDHLSLTHIAKSKQQPSRRLARMVSKLADYDFVLKYKKGSTNVMPDFLSRIEEEEGDTEKEKTDDKEEKEKRLNKRNSDDTKSPEISTSTETLEKSKFEDENFENKIEKYQKEDEFCRKIVEAKEGKLSKKDKNYKKYTKMQSKYILDSDGILKIINKTKYEDKNITVAPEKLRTLIMESHHASLLSGGHYGIKRTKEKIKTFFHWPGMTKEIQNFVKSCHSCQLYKKPKGKGYGFLKPIQVKEGNIFAHIEMDFVGPLINSNSKKYILVATDRTSKFATAIATKNADAKAVIKFLNNFITTYSCPRKITTDRGTHFKNEEVHNFCRDFGIELKHSTSYAPQSQGGVERLNQTLCGSLKHYANENPTSWSTYLPYVVLNYNTTPFSDFNGLSPYFIVYGQDPILPINLKLGNIPKNTERYSRLKQVQKIRDEIPEWILKNQEKNKKYHDKNQQEIEFKEGEEVLITNPLIDNGKFSTKYKGPYKIVKKVTPLNYVVRIPMRHGMCDETLHVRRLKKFISRDTNEKNETKKEKEENNSSDSERSETETEESSESESENYKTANSEDESTEDERPKKKKDQKKKNNTTQKGNEPEKTKGKRGRPRKAINKIPEEITPKQKRRVGRPRKENKSDQSDNGSEIPEPSGTEKTLKIKEKRECTTDKEKNQETQEKRTDKQEDQTTQKEVKVGKRPQEPLPEKKPKTENAPQNPEQNPDKAKRKKEKPKKNSDIPALMDLRPQIQRPTPRYNLRPRPIHNLRPRSRIIEIQNKPRINNTQRKNTSSRLPDSITIYPSTFLHRIPYRPPDEWTLEEAEKDAKIKTTFESLTEYVEHFRPLIMAEKEFEKKKFDELIIKNTEIKWEEIKKGQYVGTIEQSAAQTLKNLQTNEELKIYAQEENITLKGEIWNTFKNKNTIKVFVKTKHNLMKIYDLYTITPQYKNVSFDRMITALTNLEIQNTPLKKEIIEKILDPTKVTETKETDQNDSETSKTEKQNAEKSKNAEQDEPFEKHLNSYQIQAIETGVNNPLTLIQGPPGTGKSTIAKEIIKRLLKRKQGPILVCAPSNVATDQLAAAFTQTNAKVIRISAKSKKSTEDEKDQINEYTEEELQKADIICTTCSNAGNQSLAHLTFKTTLIDEAGQATEPETLIPISKTTNRIILIGDHHQLRPTICNPLNKEKLQISLFERICKTSYPRCLLQIQHRMHPAISNIASDLFYKGQISSQTERSTQSSHAIRFIHNSTIECKNNMNTSYINDGEINIIMAEIKRLTDQGITLDKIGIITPYASQRDRIKETANQHELQIEIANIDAFQGREKEYIIFSAVRSNPRGQIGFLKDWRRLNVAITRAKKGLIIIGNRHTLMGDPMWRRLLGKINEAERRQ